MTHPALSESQFSTAVDDHTIQLLAERLVIERHQRKVGEVVVRKVIETQIVEIPIRREKLIVERISPEHEQLAEIELGQGELSKEELGDIVAHLNGAVPQLNVAVPQTEKISVDLALRIIQKVMQVSKYSHAKVQLTFDHPDLQAHYQNWLSQHNE